MKSQSDMYTIYKLIICLHMALLFVACSHDTNIPKTLKLNVRMDALTYDSKGIYYYRDSVFSGVAFDSSGHKTLKSIAPYLNGKLEGNMVGFYPNGDTSYVRPYHQGEKDGHHVGYYLGGKKKYAYYFEKGFSQGNHKFWYPDGKLKQDLNYVDGKEFGSQKVWRPDGKMRSNYVVRENGRKYGMLGLKRCAKIDSEAENIDPYLGQVEQPKNEN